MWLRDFYPYAFTKSSKDSREMRRYAQYENERQWQDVFNRLFSICVNIFEWEGLPETCDQYFFESILLWRGYACIVNDEEKGGFLTLPCTPASQMNFYYDNSFYRAYTLGYSKKFMALTHWNKDILKQITPAYEADTITKGVVCFDNTQKYALSETVRLYTDKIVDAMRSIDVASRQLKFPAIIETDEDTKKSIQEAVKSIDMNTLAVYANRNLTAKLRESKAIPTGSQPAILDALWNHYNNTYSAFLTAFGINNLNTSDKKERLLTGEIDSNNEQIALNAAYRLDQRLHFCENFNAVFGTNISCKIRHQYEENTMDEKDAKQQENKDPKNKEGSEK